MAYEQRDGEGSLFKNERKTATTHADYTGSIKVAGVDYWLNCWIKRDDDGKVKRLSLSTKPKVAKPETKQQTANRMQAPHDLDDEIPY